ncbi:hypothetical protein [Plasticicumulans acidivorans]|uniref:Uncharacterized protein n=1 Tax=Plasticicumulans acidivorans TaxID=886464 RepID=A0A317MRK9_9GAMM|nr:hypothetical protein [Plasticicumulans acidivorans]PWV59505.1 hypothetical protein C7443_11050 [Plasticicumulans acidivorans]
MPQLDASRLARLIGRELDWQGRPCRVIEVLPEEQQIVIEPLDGAEAIQANQYGEATRRAPEVICLPLLNPRGDALNPLLPQLGELMNSI